MQADSLDSIPRIPICCQNPHPHFLYNADSRGQWGLSSEDRNVQASKIKYRPKAIAWELVLAEKK